MVLTSLLLGVVVHAAEPIPPAAAALDGVVEVGVTDVLTERGGPVPGALSGCRAFVGRVGGELESAVLTCGEVNLQVIIGGGEKAPPGALDAMVEGLRRGMGDLRARRVRLDVPGGAIDAVVLERVGAAGAGSGLALGMVAAGDGFPGSQALVCMGEAPARGREAWCREALGAVALQLPDPAVQRLEAFAAAREEGSLAMQVTDTLAVHWAAPVGGVIGPAFHKPLSILVPLVAMCALPHVARLDGRTTAVGLRIPLVAELGAPVRVVGGDLAGLDGFGLCLSEANLGFMLGQMPGAEDGTLDLQVVFEPVGAAR